ncbi:MAG: hypothetical protein LAQ69_27265 [Acidobacteriia bacterium]|nr:hypothetical protein [Terriglobia bacterium]
MFFVVLAFVIQVAAPSTQAGILMQAMFVAAGTAIFVFAMAAKWLRGMSLERATADDSRSPVLFLRSFEEENDARSALLSLSPVRFFSALFWGFEDRLLGTFRSYGPFTILDSRSRLMPASGAMRLGVRDEHWRDHVRELMQDAVLIIIVAGRTRGVLWEIELALTLEDRNKVLIVTRNGLEYELVRTCLSNALAGASSAPPWPHRFRFTRTYFLFMDEEGCVHSVTPSFLRSVIDRMQSPFRSSLGIWTTLVRCVPHFFEQNELPLPR